MIASVRFYIDHFDGAYEVMAVCATLFDLRGAPDTQRVFLCWLGSAHAVIGHVHFTLELSAFCVGFKRGALGALAGSES